MNSIIYACISNGWFTITFFAAASNWPFRKLVLDSFIDPVWSRLKVVDRNIVSTSP
jgi:hypothetical protein